MKAGDIKLKEVTEVHIFESPSQEDRNQGRNEGASLGEMLSLSDINYALYDITDEKSLIGAFDMFISRIKKNQKSIGAAMLHISMHGNEDGLGLTSGDFVSWESLAGHLKKFRDNLGFINMPGFQIKISPIALHFSSCEGFNGCKVNDYSDEDETLFAHVIGPTESVAWSDSLVAFTTFYHNTLSHNVSAKESLAKMNIAGNLNNIFQIKMGKGMILL